MDFSLENAGTVQLLDATVEDVVMSDVSDVVTSAPPIEAESHNSQNFSDSSIDAFISELKKCKPLSISQLKYVCEKVSEIYCLFSDS
jgi:hypothetical protein